jgi:hypothetical protein
LDRLQRPANFLDPHVLTAVGAPRINLEKKPRSRKENTKMNAGVTNLEQPSGARRLALFAVKRTAIGASAVGAQVAGALAVGAVAIGAVAIGRLILKRLIIAQSHVRSLDIAELDIKRLRVGELVVTDKLITPAHEADKI